MTCIEALQAAKDNPGKIGARLRERSNARFIVFFAEGGYFRPFCRGCRQCPHYALNVPVNRLLDEWETVPIGETK